MLNDVLKSFDKQEEKQRQRVARVPKPVTLESELERLSKLKWGSDIEIFNNVRDALLCGDIKRAGNGKMKKDDIYNFWIEIKRHRREALKQKVRDSKPDNYYIVQDLKTWVQIQRLLFQENEAAWDTETTGLNFLADRVVGVSAYLPNANIAFYVPFGHRTGETQLTESQIMEPIKLWFEDPDNRTVWHNYKYDGHMFLNHGIEVANIHWDTLVAARLLNEHEESHKLKLLYDKYCGNGEKSELFEDIIDEADIAGTDVRLAGVYACGDPYKTYKLYKFQEPYIQSIDNLKTVWYQIEKKLLPVDVRVERQGLRVDIERLRDIEQEQLPRIEQAEKNMLQAFNIDDSFLKLMSDKLGREIEQFNFSSNDHLAYLIYDVLRVGADMPRKFNKKERSTAADVIDAIIKDVPELKTLMEYRELSKLVNTYARKIPEAIDVDGRLHSQFDSLRTATGRYASSEYGNKGIKRVQICRTSLGALSLGGK